MSLKSIELQLALPKTQEIGKQQNQLNQRTSVEQSFLTSQMKLQEIEKRKKTEKTSKSEMQEQNTTRAPKIKKSSKSFDPNKGKFVDLEL